MDTAGMARKPEEELPCIWVLSGVLSYRLCDRNYECDGCELYHALSGEGRASCHHAEGTSPGSIDSLDAASPSGQANSHLSHLLAGCRLYLDRPYRPPHFWLTETEDDLVQLREALRQAGGNRQEAAKLLGVSRATLYRRLRHWDIAKKHPDPCAPRTLP